ncbi:MAG: metalloregulator ArsR/SmtB family transcription factor [Verrucomicrobiota bacterium]
MEIDGAVTSLAALAQPARLRIFRYLVRVGDEGVCAGDLAEEFDLPKPTLSFHLKELVHSGLVDSRREGRSIIYQLRVEGMRDLMTFLSDDCCQGRPELCLQPEPSNDCCEGEN